MGVEFDELLGRLEPAEEIMGDEDLAITGVAGADADGGDFEFVGELAGEVAWDTFEDDGEDAGVLEGESFSADGISGLWGAGLDFVAAELEDGLRFEADMAEDRDVRADDFFDGGNDIQAALDFDTVGAGFFDEAAGITQGVVRRDFVGEEGHIGDDGEGTGAAHDHAGVIDHLVHGDGECGAVAGDDIGEGIADEKEIERAVGEPRGRQPIVGGEGDDFIGAMFACRQRGQRAGGR